MQKARRSFKFYNDVSVIENKLFFTISTFPERHGGELVLYEYIKTVSTKMHQSNDYVKEDRNFGTLK